MNNIHEKDWAQDDGWGCHSGMRSNPYGELGDGERGDDGAGGGSADSSRGGSKSVGQDGMTTQHHPE